MLRASLVIVKKNCMAKLRKCQVIKDCITSIVDAVEKDSRNEDCIQGVETGKRFYTIGKKKRSLSTPCQWWLSESTGVLEWWKKEKRGSRERRVERIFSTEIQSAVLRGFRERSGRDECRAFRQWSVVLSALSRKARQKRGRKVEYPAVREEL